MSKTGSVSEANHSAGGANGGRLAFVTYRFSLDRPQLLVGGYLMAQFKPGDTVRLKSGGPLMTVAMIRTDGEVDCEWFDEKDQPQSRIFKPTSLVADDGDPVIA